jgi:DNA-binding NarL/FixJ family response regulator
MTQEISTSTLRIVTVDDSPLIAHRLKLLLGDVAGAELLGNADTIPAALSLIQQKKPHVVILDINLARDKPKNGIELLIVLKTIYPVVKVIMLTNLSDDHYRNLCMANGADYFLDKSNDFERIPDTLTAMVDPSWMSYADKWWEHTPLA